MWRGKRANAGGGGGNGSAELVITRKSIRRSMRKTLKLADREREKRAEGGTGKDAEMDAARLRALVIQEIVETERKYLEDMYTFIVFFVHPLKTNFADLLASPEFRVLLVQFGTVETIFEMNTDFQAELQEKIATAPDTAIGTTFNKLASSNLEYYSVFCNNQEAVLEKMKELNKNSHVRSFLQKCRGSTRTNLDVIDYIVKPFQRVLKYPLLLRELLKYTDQSHVDYAATTLALQKIQAAIDRINNNKSYSDNLRRILEINKQIGSKDMNLVHPSRVFITEGVFTKIVHGKPQTRHCFLFSDLIVFCQVKGTSRLQLCGAFPLSKANFEDAPDTKEYQNAIKVTRTDAGSSTGIAASLLGHSEQSYNLLCCSTPEEKATWMRNLLQQKASAMSDLQQKQATASAAEKKSPSTTPVPSPHQLIAPQLQQLGRGDGSKSLASVMDPRRRPPQSSFPTTPASSMAAAESDPRARRKPMVIATSMPIRGGGTSIGQCVLPPVPDRNISGSMKPRSGTTSQQKPLLPPRPGEESASYNTSEETNSVAGEATESMDVFIDDDDDDDDDDDLDFDDDEDPDLQEGAIVPPIRELPMAPLNTSFTPLHVLPTHSSEAGTHTSTWQASRRPGQQMGQGSPLMEKRSAEHSLMDRPPDRPPPTVSGMMHTVSERTFTAASATVDRPPDRPPPQPIVPRRDTAPDIRKPPMHVPPSKTLPPPPGRTLPAHR